MLAIRRAQVVKVDISSLLERPSSTTPQDNASSTSHTSSNGAIKTDSDTVLPSVIASAVLQAPYGSAQRSYQQPMYSQAYPPQYSQQYPPHYPQHGSPYAAPPGHGPLPPMFSRERRLSIPMNITNATTGGPKKRIASSGHPAESPAKKKQSKWSAEEDAAIIELRGNGMKWEDISRNLPGRSAISCRLRFQNYLERRSEWDEEKKNKLARLYERCAMISFVTEICIRPCG